MGDLELVGFEEVPEVAGLAGTWWCGSDSLIAVYRGEAEVMDAPQCRTATIYTGLDDIVSPGYSVELAALTA
ncbi:hypothetical protein ROS62_30260 [Streptomyces sp. DSM 41972]|uniref:Uncharacterized protein n=1 Tax=Streptomyces althioticus subsp. attaecolombicae TaxID=3075534 RepID=A0ABU3I7I0_9ACTN|nr:hypothetical protein [Streptomyces sp. DSM 41972]